MNVDQLKRRVAEASASVITARQAIEEGKIIDLKALEGHVDETCGAISALPGVQGRSLKPGLVALTDDLNLLADTLTREHAAMKTALDELSERERAKNAYRKLPGGG